MLFAPRKFLLLFTLCTFFTLLYTYFTPYRSIQQTPESSEQRLSESAEEKPNDKKLDLAKTVEHFGANRKLETLDVKTNIAHSSTSQGVGPSRLPYDEAQKAIQDLRKNWNPPPPQPKHWPPYQWFSDLDYDPNRWEGFEWENGYYINNGIKQKAKDPMPYLPYPDYNSVAWKKEGLGEYVACEGPGRKVLNESQGDIIHAYPTLPPNFPEATVGTADVLGLENDYCFDRIGRLGPYETSHLEVTEGWPQTSWGRLQDQCLNLNKHRYAPTARNSGSISNDTGMPMEFIEPPLRPSTASAVEACYQPRTALLIRSWHNYTYTENDKQSIRALITELNLLSGAEYQVFLLVHVKDANSTFASGAEDYQAQLNTYVPAEFHSNTILWNEKQMQDLYPNVGDWDVYWHQFMPLQWFSKVHPEFEYIWNWEVDARYIGNHYHFLEQIGRFSSREPRKYLWERNARFYFPATHGSYDEWRNDTDTAIAKAVDNRELNVVWGPQPYNAAFLEPIGPPPPHSIEDDNFEWGVGEEADLITLQPIWDPRYTLWTMRDKIFNFVPGVRPHFTEQDKLDENFHHPEFINIPRRAFINTVARFSKRQLHAMHLENLAGRTMQAEMWPATVALHHGLKAVYAPHPIWTDRRWPAWYLDAIFNANGNETAQWGARADSVYNHDREHNFGGWSWYYDSKFPRTLYRRWLGWSATVGSEEQYPNNPLRTLGGEHFETWGLRVWFPPEVDSVFGGQELQVGGKGRMCLPPMLLHPVKNVYEEAESVDSSSLVLENRWSRMFGW